MYEIKPQADSVLGVKLCHKVSGYTQVVYTVYLPPSTSPFGKKSHEIFECLQGELFLNMGVDEVDGWYCLGDMNARIGSEKDASESDSDPC